MKTLEELKAVLTQELLELEKLAGIWPSTNEKRHVKEQEIGRHCYEAEEDLSPLELGTLKRAMASLTRGGEHTRPNLLRGVPLESWRRSFQLWRSVTCVGRSQSAGELDSVTNLVCLIGCDYPFGLCFASPGA